MAPNKTEKIEVENVNHPGRVRSVDADMYDAMKRAYLTVLPKTPPGLTLAEIRDRLIAHPARGTVSGRRQGRLVGEDRSARFGGERCYCAGENRATPFAQGTTLTVGLSMRDLKAVVLV